ncbi:hypothetical protein O988_00739, partial [Pseudogymnoascus sp. VKM F-3808]
MKFRVPGQRRGVLAVMGLQRSEQLVGIRPLIWCKRSSTLVITSAEAACTEGSMAKNWTGPSLRASLQSRRVIIGRLSTRVVQQMMTASAPSQIVRSTLDVILPSSVQSLALRLLKSRKQSDFNIEKTLAETSKLVSPQLADEFHFHSYAKAYWLQHIFCISEQESL